MNIPPPVVDNVIPNNDPRLYILTYMMTHDHIFSTTPCNEIDRFMDSHPLLFYVTFHAIMGDSMFEELMVGHRKPRYEEISEYNKMQICRKLLHIMIMYHDNPIQQHLDTEESLYTNVSRKIDYMEQNREIISHIMNNIWCAIYISYLLRENEEDTLETTLATFYNQLTQFSITAQRQLIREFRERLGINLQNNHNPYNTLWQLLWLHAYYETNPPFLQSPSSPEHDWLYNI